MASASGQKNEWDVRMPPIKRHMVAGHLVPNVSLGFLMQKRRKVAIEVISGKDRSISPFTGHLDPHDDVVLRIYRLSKRSKDDGDEGTCGALTIFFVVIVVVVCLLQWPL